MNYQHLQEIIDHYIDLFPETNGPIHILSTSAAMIICFASTVALSYRSTQVSVSFTCAFCVLNPAYKTIHDGAVACDYFLLAVLPLDAELNTAILHEVYREEDQAGEGWKECVRCHKPFIPGSNRQRYCASCGEAANQARSREKQRRYRERRKAAL